jgi:hypothetical protein
VYLRAAGLDALREWESEQPHLMLYGSAGIGKSVLLQLAALRALVCGEKVFVHMKGTNMMIEMADHLASLDGADWVVAHDVSMADFGSRGRYRLANTVMCFDSEKGFNSVFGDANVWKKVLVVHSPTADRTQSEKAEGLLGRFFLNPTSRELIAIGEIKGITVDEVVRRIARYGLSIRYLCDAKAERKIEEGIDEMVGCGIAGLANLRITVMLPKPPPAQSAMVVFASDFIRDEVVRRLAESHASELLRLANTVDIDGSLRGQIFASRMLDLLGRAGATVEIKTRGALMVLQIAGAGVLLSLDHSLPAGQTVQPSTLYHPQHSNLKSWDAIIVESAKTAYVLQLTVAHDPSHQSCAIAGASFLQSHGFSTKGVVHMVCLVPPSVFGEFAVSQMSLAGGSQVMWGVDKVDGVAFWPVP